MLSAHCLEWLSFYYLIVYSKRTAKGKCLGPATNVLNRCVVLFCLVSFHCQSGWLFNVLLIKSKFRMHQPNFNFNHWSLLARKMPIFGNCRNLNSFQLETILFSFSLFFVGDFSISMLFLRKFPVSWSQKHGSKINSHFEFTNFVNLVRSVEFSITCSVDLVSIHRIV